MKKNINNYDDFVPAYALMSWYDDRGNEIEFDPNNGIDETEICKVAIWDINGTNYYITNKTTYQEVEKIEHTISAFAVDNKFIAVDLHKYLFYALDLILKNNKEP